MRPTLPVAALMVLFFNGNAAAAQQTDPFQYQVRIRSEAQQYLSNCSSAAGDQGTQIACKTDGAKFASKYYEALEGNTDDQWDIGLMFSRGALHGVTPNPILSCAWWIVTDDSGGTLPVNPSVRTLAYLCRRSPVAVSAAKSIEAEMTKVANLTY